MDSVVELEINESNSTVTLEVLEAESNEVALSIDQLVSDSVSLNVSENLSPVTLNILEEAVNVQLDITEGGGLQGPPGPPGDQAYLLGQNNDVVTIKAGKVVAKHPSGSGFVLADKDLANSLAIGVATEDAAPGFTVTVQAEGSLDLSDWSESLGSSSFTPLSTVFLGNSGNITTAVPSTGFLQVIGSPVKPKSLFIRIDEPVKRSN